MLDFSVSSLMAGFVFGVIGMWLFKEGKKKYNYTILFIGILLMIYPYFTNGIFADWGVGFILCGVAYNSWNK